MYTIQANPSGTRSLEISEDNLTTIEKYGLFCHHNNMKALGLQQLIKLYLEWLSKQDPTEE